MGIHKLSVQTATAAALAPYGNLIGPAGIANANVSPFYDGHVATARPAEFVSDGDTCISVAMVQPRPFEVKFIERHHQHTQAFIPLGGKPFIGVFAPPSDGEAPRLEDLAAFLFDGQDGFCMHIGTWHEFPFALAANTNLVIILRNETMRDLTQIAHGEAHGDDLDKLNVARRFGTPVSVDPEAALR